MGWDAMIFVFWMLSFKPTASLFSSTFIKRLFSFSLLSCIKGSVICVSEIIDVSSCNLDSSLCFIQLVWNANLAFHMMYSAFKLNKQGDNVQPWFTPSPIWNQSVVQCPVLTVTSWPAYRFLRRQVRWSGIPICWRISTVCGDPHSQRLWHNQ